MVCSSINLEKINIHCAWNCGEGGKGETIACSKDVNVKSFLLFLALGRKFFPPSKANFNNFLHCIYPFLEYVNNLTFCMHMNSHKKLDQFLHITKVEYISLNGFSKMHLI